jgi:hypothetical protein
VGLQVGVEMTVVVARLYVEEGGWVIRYKVVVMKAQTGCSTSHLLSRRRLTSHSRLNPSRGTARPAAAADVGLCSITVSLAGWRPGGSPLGQVWRLEPLPSAAAPLRIPTTLSETGTDGVRVVVRSSFETMCWSASGSRWRRGSLMDLSSGVREGTF